MHKLQKKVFLTRVRPGVWATFARPRVVDIRPPDNSKTKKDSDKQ